MGMFGGDANAADTNNDGTISFDEFFAFMKEHYGWSKGKFVEKTAEAA